MSPLILLATLVQFQVYMSPYVAMANTALWYQSDDFCSENDSVLAHCVTDALFNWSINLSIKILIKFI